MSNLVQTGYRRICSNPYVLFITEILGGGDSSSAVKRERPDEDMAAGHALVFKGVIHGPKNNPPSEYERAARGFGLCHQLGFWSKRWARPLCF
ncbi:MAG: hypothetical protein ACLQVL_04570 [Terriglobia bacterium]